MLFSCLIIAGILTRAVILTDDGKVKKVVVQSGSGPQPSANDKALIHYTGFLPDGTPYDSSRGHNPVEFTLGRGVISGWSIGVRSMAVGEISNFTIDYDYAYGEKGYPPIVPPKTELSFEIELLSIAS